MAESGRHIFSNSWLWGRVHSRRTFFSSVSSMEEPLQKSLATMYGVFFSSTILPLLDEIVCLLRGYYLKLWTIRREVALSLSLSLSIYLSIYLSLSPSSLLFSSLSWWHRRRPSDVLYLRGLFFYEDWRWERERESRESRERESRERECEWEREREREISPKLPFISLPSVQKQGINGAMVTLQPSSRFLFLNQFLQIVDEHGLSLGSTGSSSGNGAGIIEPFQRFEILCGVCSLFCPFRFRQDSHCARKAAGGEHGRETIHCYQDWNW